MNRRVLFPGHGQFWFDEGADGSGVLYGQYDPEGSGDGYAYVNANGAVCRHHQHIGHRDELIDIPEFATGDDFPP